MANSKFKIQNSKLGNKGQMMLLSIMILGGVFAIGLSVAILLLSEFRLSRQSLDSVKAIYAADAGVECELFQYFKNPDWRCISGSTVIFLNDTSFLSQRTAATNGTATTVSAIGISKGIRRGLEAEITFDIEARWPWRQGDEWWRGGGLED
jgi:hypothetical protein